MENPSIALIPSAYKASKLYSVLPTNGDGDFTHVRASVATRINEVGLIEEVAANVPRLDYTDGGCPVLLLEPQSTNLYLNSDILVTQGITTLADSYTVSFYGTGTITFTGTHSASLVGTGVNERVSLSFTATAGTLTSTVSGTVINAQAEKLDYSTSWILTTGSTVTRLKDQCSNAGTTSDFNSEEGVLYIEYKTLSELGTFRQINIIGNSANRLYISKRENNGNLEFRMDNPLGDVNFSFSINTTNDYIKVAYRWGLNNFAVFIDGVNKNVSPTGGVFTANTMASLDFKSPLANQEFYGKIKDLRVYKTALTDLELQTLTT